MPLSLYCPGFSISRNKLESPEATIFIGWYSFVLHLLFGFYCLDVYRGSNSDWVFSPLFELSGQNLATVSISLALYSFLYMFFASLGLIRGVNTETRIYYFPWLFLTAAELVYQFYHIFFLNWRYSVDPNTNFATVVLSIFLAYHVYQYMVVLSNYRFLKRMQNPTLIFPTMA